MPSLPVEREKQPDQNGRGSIADAGTAEEGSVRIGELAALAGKSTRTIRFYESIGLLSEPPRTAGGYRDYGVEAIDDLRAIRTLQAAGFALSEISDILTLSLDPDSCDGRLVDLVIAKQTEINVRLAACQRVKAQLQDILDHLVDPSGGDAQSYGPTGDA